MAARLQSALRDSDHLSRLGGDEFAILLSELADARDAGVVAEAILKQLTEPFVLGDHHLRVSASLGIATYPFVQSGMEGFLKQQMSRFIVQKTKAVINLSSTPVF